MTLTYCELGLILDEGVCSLANLFVEEQSLLVLREMGMMECEGLIFLEFGFMVVENSMSF